MTNTTAVCAPSAGGRATCLLTGCRPPKLSETPSAAAHKGDPAELVCDSAMRLTGSLLVCGDCLPILKEEYAIRAFRGMFSAQELHRIVDGRSMPRANVSRD